MTTIKCGNGSCRKPFDESLATTVRYSVPLEGLGEKIIGSMELCPTCAEMVKPPEPASISIAWPSQEAMIVPPAPEQEA